MASDPAAAASEPSTKGAANAKPAPRNAANHKHRNIILRLLGPGLVTGAHFGYGLLWTVFLTTPFMIAIQLVSAFIGRVTGQGIVANVKQFYPRWLVVTLVALLVVANVANLAADIAAMGEALALVIGGLKHEHALIFAAGSVLLQIFVPFHRYEPILKVLTLVLFLYVGVVFTVDIPWKEVAIGTLLPKPTLNYDYFVLVVAVLGTTISPYLFFWQAAQEVEVMRRHKRPALKALKSGGSPELKRIGIDTSVGMIFSNLIAYFIILTTAATLHAHGVTDVQTAADAANALRPIAGELAFLMFALGIIGTGLLAIPVLAGSAAYCVAEAFGWPSTLEAKFPDAVGFYVIILAATVIGFGLGFTPIDPIQMLVWSAVINGIVAVPIMAMMMMVVASKAVMGRFTARRRLVYVGWGATAVMAVAAVGLIVTLFV